MSKGKVNQRPGPQKGPSLKDLTPIIVAVIGIIGTVLVAVFTNWDKLFPETPTPVVLSTPTMEWPILPPVTGLQLPTSENPPFRISGFSVEGIEPVIPIGKTAAKASAMQLNQLTPSMTREILLKFDITSTASQEYGKVENRLLLRVDKFELLAADEQQEILGAESQGGPGFTTKFFLNTKGPIRVGDILQTPPADGADWWEIKPGELLAFSLASRWDIPPGRYTFTPGFEYTYEGEKKVMWLPNSFTAVSPNNPIYWHFEKGQWSRYEK